MNWHYNGSHVSKLAVPRIEGRPEMAICHDTIHAMRSGVIFGFVGQMDGIITRMKKELGGQAFVVVTGL